MKKNSPLLTAPARVQRSDRKISQFREDIQINNLPHHTHILVQCSVIIAFTAPHYSSVLKRPALIFIYILLSLLAFIEGG